MDAATEPAAAYLPAHPSSNGQRDFSDRFLRRLRLSCASFFNRSAFDTVSTMRSALLNRSPGVLPGTSGIGSGFIVPPLVILATPVVPAEASSEG